MKTVKKKLEIQQQILNSSLRMRRNTSTPEKESTSKNAPGFEMIYGVAGSSCCISA